MAADGKLYEQFEPQERLTLVLQAMARDDEAEVERLGGSCPRATYTMRDAAFVERLELAFGIMTVVCIDLRGLWAKLDMLHWCVETARLLATHHQISGSFAFMDVERFGKQQPQMDYFARKHEPDEQDQADDSAADDEQPDLAPPEPVRASAFREGELARRMMAVEDRMQGMTDEIFLAFAKAAHDIAQQLVDTWEAFGRFCRERVGVEPETLLDAWGFPVSGDFTAMLKRYENVKPDPAKVEEYFGLICSNWDKRFGD